jgi:hypothetical protein
MGDMAIGVIKSRRILSLHDKRYKVDGDRRNDRAPLASRSLVAEEVINSMQFFSL